MQRLPCLVLAIAAACGGGPSPAPKAPLGNAGGTAAAARTVHDVDWMNRTYRLPNMEGSGTDDYAVVKGEAAITYEDPEDSAGWFQVAPPIFGDVDGDGADEAIIVSELNTGGTGRFDAATVYTMRGGEPVILDTIPGGDRGDGGLVEVRPAAGAIEVTRNLSVDGDGACCPSKVQHERWRWRDGKIVEDERARTIEDNPNAGG